MEYKNRGFMKKLLVLAMMCSSLAHASNGTVKTKINVNYPEVLDITIYGKAAGDISTELTKAGKEFRLDPFSSKFVQSGKGIRCIKKLRKDSPYCYLSLENGEI